MKCDENLLKAKGWSKVVREWRGRGGFLELNIDHPAQDLLKKYKSRGVPVKMSHSSMDKGHVG